MKTISTLLVAFVLTVSASAQTRPVNVFTSWWGNWSVKSNWSLNRLPEDGDSVVIPAGKGVVIDKNFSFDEMYLKVMGTVQVKKNLTLDEKSFIEVGAAGRITAFGADRKNETIKLNNKKKFDEKTPMDVTGISYANEKTGVSPSGFIYDALLPVKFISFTAIRQSAGNVLSWVTAQEKENSHFEVEKSTDGRNWTMLVMVLGNGTTNQTSRYQYTDKNENSAVVYYRIRQVDTDGKASYTDVKTIKTAAAASAMNIFASSPNQITVALNSGSFAQLEVKVLSLDGRVVAQSVHTNAAYQVKQNVPSLPKGIYVVQVNDFNGNLTARKVAL